MSVSVVRNGQGISSLGATTSAAELEALFKSAYSRPLALDTIGVSTPPASPRTGAPRTTLPTSGEPSSSNAAALLQARSDTRATLQLNQALSDVALLRATPDDFAMLTQAVADGKLPADQLKNAERQAAAYAFSRLSLGTTSPAIEKALARGVELGVYSEAQANGAMRSFYQATEGPAIRSALLQLSKGRALAPEAEAALQRGIALGLTTQQQVDSARAGGENLKAAFGI